MAALFDPTDPRHLTPEQRLDELTAVLAIGVRRVLALHVNPVKPAQSGATPPPAESGRNSLDVSAQMRLHVPGELTEAKTRKGVKA